METNIYIYIYFIIHAIIYSFSKRNMTNCIVEVEQKCASPTPGFVLKTSKIGRMATCGGALHWATYCCFFSSKLNNLIGSLRFLGQIHHLKMVIVTVLKGAVQAKWSVPSIFLLLQIFYMSQVVPVPVRNILQEEIMFLVQNMCYSSLNSNIM